MKAAKKKAKTKPKMVAKRKRDFTVVIDASVRADLIRSIENDWRALAADAIEAARQLAGVYEDSAGKRVASQLERRMHVLAGQLEMFA